MGYLVIPLVVAAGAAALSWELLWQVQSTLALGVSALGTAITLTCTMGGMTAGALGAGRWLRGSHVRSPLVLYGACELVVGISGLLLGWGFGLLERLDAWVWQVAPSTAPLVQVLGIAALLGPPTIAMGATIPILGLVARKYGTSLARLYAGNTAGAAIGVIAMAFVAIPELGLEATSRVAAGLDITVALLAVLLARTRGAAPAEAAPPVPGPALGLARPRALLLAFVTGFATFALEVSWFRSLRAAFQSTTDSFAIILVSVLVPLAIGAQLAPWTRRRLGRPEPLLVAAGVAVLLATPLLERFDMLPLGGGSWAGVLWRWTWHSLVVMGPAVILLGSVLPWLLDEAEDTGAWSRLYGVNTAGAIAGSLIAAWVLLPAVGFARASWLVGLLVVGVGAAPLARRGRLVAASLGVAALATAVLTESGVGRDRILFPGASEDYAILDFEEAPDSTVSVIERGGGGRVLVIDGFQASTDGRSAGYMEWMGRLPMLLHDAPRRALVICYGTGQTANSMLREGPGALDVVELSGPVLSMAPLFEEHASVLTDERTTTRLMDGRAWLRRTTDRYDAITLEPMPPNFAGVNALYSVEFYRLAAARLNPGGLVAQWVPFHIIPPSFSKSIAGAFIEVFPDAVLWIDPESSTGILVGRVEPVGGPLGSRWPGLARAGTGRRLAPGQVVRATALGPTQLTAYASGAPLVTDDNQRLAYGRFRAAQLRYGPALTAANRRAVDAATE